MLLYLNGTLVEKGEAKISVYDHGFLYGDGVYETLRAYDGVAFMLDEHLSRLSRSASLIRLTLPRPVGGIADAVRLTLSANALQSAYVRLSISRGPGPIGLDPALCPEPTFVIMAEPLHPYPPAFYADGISLTVAGTRRNLPAALDPRIKSLNFLNNILAKIEAKDAAAYEALMLNAEGFLTEGTISNLFFLRDGELCTPAVSCGILDGITRSIILRLARQEGIPVREGEFTPADLREADEVFISNTTMEVMPVSRVDDQAYPVGSSSRALRGAYAEVVRQYVKERQAARSSG